MVSRHEPSPAPTLGCLCSVFWPGGFWSIFVSKCSHRVTANSGAEDLEEQKRSTWSGLCGSPATDSCFKWCYSGCFHWFHCIFPVFPHSQHLTSSCETCWHNALWKHCACSPGVKMLVSKAILLDLIGNPQITNYWASFHLTTSCSLLLVFENPSPKVARAMQGVVSICRVPNEHWELQISKSSWE